MIPRQPRSTLFPYTTLFRSQVSFLIFPILLLLHSYIKQNNGKTHMHIYQYWLRSEEHTSELQSRGHLVCRLLLEKKKTLDIPDDAHHTRADQRHESTHYVDA